ncbi:uncharacterized protein LOC122949237 isoform X1 [Acropora millepora]|uniref:uncharacterized protein LOC122949237 isoform X1 n=1 Tax=Acropora millepora TaxID=45264 RepID=UPI001CF562D3|nr:uncharacterized protein LOC122949237 isoform X1 [Acropora millepora]
MKVKYPMYSWILRTLSRRLHHFGITYTDYSVDIEEVREAVEKEMKGPGRLLGYYRSLHKKVREIHGLKVPRNLVYDVMADVYAEGLEERGGVGMPKRPKKTGTFTSNGSDSTMSLDGHNKLCGFQNSMFPLCICGAQDTFSSRIQFLRIWTSNSSPRIIGRFYFDYLFERRVLPDRIRVDRGTETGLMATIHSYLRAQCGDVDDGSECVFYGPSTQNKIERWWKELLERMERFFKIQSSTLVEDGDYDASDDNDRKMLAYVYIPVIQKELDVFRISVWNAHRIRKQKEKELPVGVPEHIYTCPERHGGEKCGFAVTEEQLREVAELANILDGTDDFLLEDFRQECQRHLPNTEDIEPDQAPNAFLYLKSRFSM